MANRKKNAGVSVGLKRFGHRSHMHKEHVLRSPRHVRRMEDGLDALRREIAMSEYRKEGT